jgi:4-amino-4-deoxy-L-arabinose transferase-like glycosyltransferase
MNPKPLAKILSVAVIIMMALTLRFAHLGQMPLLPDEAYYWLWSRQLDWAYYDHPAGTAILLRLSTALGGHGEFGIRWLNALLATAGVALAISLAQRIYSQKAGLLVGALMAFGAPFLITSQICLYRYPLFAFITSQPS